MYENGRNFFSILDLIFSYQETYNDNDKNFELILSSLDNENREETLRYFLSREIKLMTNLINVTLAGCRNYALHGCFMFLTSVCIYISHRWPRRPTGTSFDILTRQTCDSSDNTCDPCVTDCHLFLAISFLLCSISATNPARFLLLSLSLHSRCLFLQFQIQIREIARRTVTLRLENWRSRWPFEYRFEIPNSMDAAGEMITLHLGCAKGVNKNETRPSKRLEGDDEERGRR